MYTYTNKHTYVSYISHKAYQSGKTFFALTAVTFFFRCFFLYQALVISTQKMLRM